MTPPEGEEDGYPKWWKLAKSTRDDYLDAFDYLRPEFDIAAQGYHSAGSLRGARHLRESRNGPGSPTR